MTMRTTSPLVTFRRLTGCMLVAAAPLALMSPASFAQGAPSPDAPVAGQSVDPPSRVARLNYMAGTVTTEPAGANDWSYASVNRPITTGDQLWNDANARSELHIGSTAVRLGASTNLDILNLDDSNAQLKVTQGTLSTHVRDLAPGSAYEIDTPNVALAVTRPGDYRVDVAPDGSTTTVTVRRGAITAYGDSGQMPLAAGQQLTFSGTNLQVAADNQTPPPDAFDRWAEARDAAAERSRSARYVSREIPGYEDLDANGIWRDDPQYGEVWVPSAVPVGWAPYHDGHWAWVAPWGWTWVDDAPWGFAPYHYGRWAYVGSSWCWVPGPIISAPPVYAPALVAFVGGGDGGFNWSIGLTIGGVSAPGVAWFPLGPGEVWRPSYGGWSPQYYQRVNQTVIVNQNINNININNIHNTYINYHAPGAVTAVPATAFVQGRAVAHVAQRIDPQQLRNAQFHPGAPGIAPVRESYASGLRPATYHPPGALGERSVIATRAPGVPAVYRDPLAQRLAQNSGGQVPGAGRPVEHLTPPAGIAAQLAHPTANIGPARNVRVVERQSPVITPRQAENAGRPNPGAPAAAQGGARPGPQQQQHAPMTALQGQPQTNGVPRPPRQRSPAESTPGAVAARREPTWTQPHAPIAQQHGPSAQPGPARGEPASRQQGIGAPHAPEHGQQGMMATARPGGANLAAPQATPHVPQPRMEPHSQPQAAPQQPRADAPMQQRVEPRAQPQAQPRVEQPQPQPHFEQARPQPQPHFEQPRPQPQPQAHFEQPRPQPQPQPQVHFEQPRQPQPQPQPQPHFEQPRPQPQPHEPQHPQAQTHENHHQG